MKPKSFGEQIVDSLKSFVNDLRSGASINKRTLGRMWCPECDCNQVHRIYHTVAECTVCGEICDLPEE